MYNSRNIYTCFYVYKYATGISSAIAIASFGPIEIRKSSPKYGYITNTPKPGWQDTDFVGPFKKHFNIPSAWTTDVNGSAYGEYVLSTLDVLSLNDVG